tara:strand:+ start:28 stop:495 length:468 start_codon:yes stop_codon:yes gene_type:complete
MADLESKLSSLLERSSLNAKYQDGGIILYNRDQDHLSRGLLVSDVKSAVRMVQLYLRYLRTEGFMPINQWAKQSDPSLSYKDVSNKSDPRSYYFVQGMSSVSRANLLSASKELYNRAEASAILDTIPSLTESEQRRHLKIKKIAAIYRASTEETH